MPWWNRQLKEQKPQLRPDPAHAQLPCDPEAVGSSSSRHSVCSSEARAERGVWKTPSAGAGSDGARLSLRLRCVRKYALPSQVWTAEHVVYLRQRLFRPVLVAMYQDCHCSGAREAPLFGQPSVLCKDSARKGTVAGQEGSPEKL